MGKLMQVCIVGDANRPEFQYALSNVSDSAEICLCSALDELFHLKSHPDAVILLQTYPGEYSASDIDRAVQFNPISALVLVTSSWCEGERRTGIPIRSAVRVPWYDFRLWFERQKSLFETGRLSQLSLPLSASDAQRALLDSQNEFPDLTNDVIWIFSDSAVQRETLSRFYALLGARVWSGGMATSHPEELQLAQPTRIVVYPDFLTDDCAKKTAQLKESNQNAKIFVIAYQPRIEEIESLRLHGADEVLSPEFYQFASF